MFSVYADISYYSQLLQLKPKVLESIEADLYELAVQYGGSPQGPGLYRFPSATTATVRKTAEALMAFHRRLQKDSQDLYGTTVLLMEEGESWEQEEILEKRREYLLLQVSDEDGIWMDKSLKEFFQIHLELELKGLLFRVKGLKERGQQLEDCLHELMFRPERAQVIRQALESMRKEQNNNILVLGGALGMGKRATLSRVLSQWYPQDEDGAVVLTFSREAGDPLEPFIRALSPFLEKVAHYLEGEELLWWETAGLPLLQAARRYGGVWPLPRDQVSVDFIQAFSLYLKSYAEDRKRSPLPAFLLVDGVDPANEAFTWLRSLMSEFSQWESFKLIIIRDEEAGGRALPLPGRGKEVIFRGLSKKELMPLYKASKSLKSEEDLEPLKKKSPGAVIPFFHTLLAQEKGLSLRRNPSFSLVRSFDEKTQITFFLARISQGLIKRHTLIQRFQQDEDAQTEEGWRYDHLITLGFLREDADGTITIPFPLSAKSWNNVSSYSREAEEFGEYLWNRQETQKDLCLLRLFRYLEAWGSTRRALTVLYRLLEALLSSRRFRLAGILLNGRPLMSRDLSASDMEALQNIMGANRLRYLLLAGERDRARGLVKDGTISLIGARGEYAEGFRLQIARYNYAFGRSSDALKDAKEALFSFQKSGNHQGETEAHLELAQALLALGRTRDALEHFGIARRIGFQVSNPRGLLRGGVLETVTRYLFGNLPRALRDGNEVREQTRKEGCREDWFLLTLLLTRITFELGRWEESEKIAAEGVETAQFYNLEDQKRVLNNWRGRALAASGRGQEGRALWQSCFPCREAYYFCADSAWLAGEKKQARHYIQLALGEPQKNSYFLGEQNHWADGFTPVEGRFFHEGASLDVLEERVQRFFVFLHGSNEKLIASQGLSREIKEAEGPQPFGYLYAFWRFMTKPAGSKSHHQQNCSAAFNQLQARAGRFDDNQAKRSWLTMNPWNNRIMEEAQRQKLL